MKIEKDWTIPAAPQRAYEVITDQAFVEHTAAEMGAIEYRAEVSDNGPGTSSDNGRVITVHRSMPTDHVPGALRKLVGEHLPIVETQTWHAADAAGGHTADLDVDISGLPVRFTGTITLAGTGDRTTVAVRGDLKAAIPFVGGNVEKAAAPALKSALDVEARESIAWVQSH